MVAHTIAIPDWLELFLSSPILFYRRLRYGYSFRRIGLTKGQFAIVDAWDYPKVSTITWHAQQGRCTYYAGTTIILNGKRTTVQMQRFLMGVSGLRRNSGRAGVFVDHINGNGLDNRRVNLRLCTALENTYNRRAKKNCISKFKGVSVRYRNRWRARITVGKKMIDLGSYDSEIQAAEAYDMAALKYHGKFARLNFPQKKSFWKRFLKKLRSEQFTNKI